SATGSVTPKANAVPSGNDCSATNSCQFANVGGLVGQNQGEILGLENKDSLTLKTASAATAAKDCGGGVTCASGMVNVGPGGTGGGLVGFNDGIISHPLTSPS